MCVIIKENIGERELIQNVIKIYVVIRQSWVTFFEDLTEKEAERRNERKVNSINVFLWIQQQQNKKKKLESYI
jgi:flagellar biosynthesis regulator FlaF